MGRLTKPGIKVLIGTFCAPFMQGAMFFISAGHINIIRGWCYVVIGFIGMFGGIAVVSKLNPELVNERGLWRKKKGVKGWDKIVVRLYLLFGFYVPFITAGLDVGRYHWSYLGVYFGIAGCVMFITGAVFIHWAMLVNRHFEAMVRIQNDRSHQVITKGPYKIVRHPGYLGAILWGISTPLIIGSAYGLIPAGTAIIVLVIRTYLEDKLLGSELNGYDEYRKRVRYRLLPGIW
ncbi:MAG: isoprenylcysteine carboxylmethyltransferase family protein [Sedimentisphaerales bacterium]|nr:isoprenylcysteine carboxylmethyltransferase family protein [Sedimentisphaerales bacterium]